MRSHVCTAECRPDAHIALPVEYELVDGAWYLCCPEFSAPQIGMWSARRIAFVLIRAGTITTDITKGWQRLAPVARYEPPKPETPEPKGVGAVVRDARNFIFVRTSIDANFPWDQNRINHECRWDQIKQPVEVLSEGVEL